MAVGELVSDRQDERDRPFQDLQGGQYADTCQKGELFGRGQFDVRAEYVQSDGVVGNGTVGRRARSLGRGVGRDGLGFLGADS